MKSIFFLSLDWFFARLEILCTEHCVIVVSHSFRGSLSVVLTGDFFKDLQEEYKNWEASASSQGKPKSLWEELAVSPIISNYR